jgi:hypothetical protein
LSAISTSSGTACSSGCGQLGAIFVLHRAPQAVGAQQHAVALLQLHRPRQVEHRLGRRTQAGEQDVAVDVGWHAQVRLLLHVGMVARAGQQLAIAQQVKPGIAAMHPVHAAALHDGRHQRGAGRVEHAFFAA